jgi:hypothetical protein
VVVGVVLFDFELALVVQQAIEDEGRVAVGELDWQTVKSGVVIGDEGVKLQRELAKARAVGLLENPVWEREALSVAGRAPAFAPL